MVSVIVFLIFFLLFSAIKVLNEYERGVILRLGRFVGIRGPGLIILIPVIEKLNKVSLRTFV
jgi:regulator of protease activity HflC (stomatin/prohibitin superfamily)